MEAMAFVGIGPLKEIILRSHLESETAFLAWHELLQTGRSVDLECPPELPMSSTTANPETIVASQEYWNKLSGQTRQEVTQYHKNNPLRPGMPREELKSRLKILVKNSPRIFNAAIGRLVASGDLVESGPLLHLPGFEVRLSPIQDQNTRKLLEKFAASPYSPPSVKECQGEIGEDLFEALVGLDLLVQVSPEVAFRKEDYTRMVEEITRLIRSHGVITAAEVRDHFNTSRRYALAILEHLDAVGLTIREGDARRLKNSPAG
jgi:selenocysteine-specific elongation factor